jgi:hypothetical protein
MLSFSNKIGRMLIVVLGVFMLASCAHGSKETKTKLARIVESAPVKNEGSSVVGAVLDADTLAQGGEIALVPFKAGTNAEATDELDRLSLIITKGITDSLNAQATSLKVVDAAEGKPRVALQGYIEEFSRSGKMSRVMMRPNEMSFSVVGEVWLISDGKRLLTFSTDKRFDPKKQKAVDAAYHLGKEIGDFIGAHAKAK